MTISLPSVRYDSAICLCPPGNDFYTAEKAKHAFIFKDMPDQNTPSDTGLLLLALAFILHCTMQGHT